MGNCLGSDEKARDNEQFDTILTFKQSFKVQWLRMLKADEIPYYQSNYLSKRHEHPSFIQIEKDIDRTYPNQPEFHIPVNKATFQVALKEVALYFPKNGYIQGLNFLVGYFILSDMSQLESIKAFVAAATHPKLLLFGLYEQEFPLARFNCELFWTVFKYLSPSFAQKIDELNLPDELWIFQWFLCLYIYSFPRYYVKDILSYIWQQKQFASIKIALAIMSFLEPSLMQSKNRFEDQFIQNIELLKSEEYVLKNLPIARLIKKAKKYDTQMIRKHIKNVSIENEYRRYFELKDQERKELYSKFLERREKQRIEFYDLVKSGVKVDQKRSLTIIDYIEELRVAKIGDQLINSLNQRAVSSSFARFQKRYSLSQQRDSKHPTLVESFYQK